jgi:hypothetical protein
MAKHARSSKKPEPAGDPDALLKAFVELLARRAAERDDAASRKKASRTALPTGGKGISR